MMNLLTIIFKIYIKNLSKNIKREVLIAFLLNSQEINAIYFHYLECFSPSINTIYLFSLLKRFSSYIKPGEK